jgi:hypothetical protein
MQSKHWTQELPNHPDAKNAKVTYFTAQNRVFQLDDKNMPPDCIKQLAKVMVKIEDDGSLTESPIEKEDDADGETDEDSEYCISHVLVVFSNNKQICRKSIIARCPRIVKSSSEKSVVVCIMRAGGQFSAIGTRHYERPEQRSSV